MSVPVWTRRHPPQPGREAEVVLYVFSCGDPEKGPLSAARFGLPAGGLHGVEVRRHARADGPAWFDRFRTGPLRASAQAHLPDLTVLDAADTCHTIRVQGSDPPDLGYLQAAWAVARWFLASEGTVLLDGMAIRYHAALGPPPPHLRVRDHVSLLLETRPTVGDDGYAMHTRGLRSFGRPDLVTVTRPTDADAVAPVVLNLAAALADGWLPTGPTEIEVGGGEVVVLHADPGLAFVTALNLNNDALVLTDARGGALTGFASAPGPA